MLALFKEQYFQSACIILALFYLCWSRPTQNHWDLVPQNIGSNNKQFILFNKKTGDAYRSVTCAEFKVAGIIVKDYLNKGHKIDQKLRDNFWNTNIYKDGASIIISKERFPKEQSEQISNSRFYLWKTLNLYAEPNFNYKWETDYCWRPMRIEN